MIFGDIDRFAIQLERGAYFGGAWLYGTFNYWIAGDRIGDESDMILGDILTLLTYVRGDGGKRSSEILCHLPRGVAIETIDIGLQAETADDWDSTVFADTFPASHDISVPTESMMGWRVYLIDYAEQSRLIWKNPESSDPAHGSSTPGIIREFVLRQGEVDAIIEAAAAQLETFCAEIEAASGAKET